MKEKIKGALASLPVWALWCVSGLPYILSCIGPSIAVLHLPTDPAQSVLVASLRSFPTPPFLLGLALLRRVKPVAAILKFHESISISTFSLRSKNFRGPDNSTSVFVFFNRCRPLWSNGQSYWLQIQRSRVRFPALSDFLRSSGSGTGSTQPREDNWGDTWKDSCGSGLENRN
jgi:hypothetical protein